MPALEDILANRAEVTVKWRTEALVITYAPGKLTGEFLAEWAGKLRGLTGDDEFQGVYPAYLAAFVVGWDLTKGGKPLDVSAEAIRALPHSLQRAIEAACVADTRAEGNAAFGASREPSEKGEPPTGTG